MEKRALTVKQAEEIGFNRGEYSAPKVEGDFVGTLIMKIYGEQNIYCYFITEIGEKIRVNIWYDDRKDNSFHPRKCDIDFSYVPLNTKWRITIETSRKGKLKWTNAVAAE